MRHPPLTSIQPKASVVYRFFALITAIILIALSAYFIRANSLFDLKNAVFVVLCTGMILWLLRDAFFAPDSSQGQLIYSEGAWFWQHDGNETQGTLRLHLDLQSYLLASFAPTQVQTTTFFPRVTQWFHLEARQLDPAVRSARWLALRRAVYATAQPSHEEWAA